MMSSKEKANIQENLVKLYLRLNGYFTTGFIIHSEENKINSEIDNISIRFPYHQQNDTEHNSSSYLNVSKNIDIIISEVKSNNQKLQFNKSLYQKNCEENWAKLLFWVGVFNSSQIEKISIELVELVKPKQNSKLQDFRIIENIDTSFGLVNIKTILFSPERISSNSSDKIVNWTEINDFIWACLCPNEKRINCGTRYDFTAWGTEFEDIVKVYKSRQEVKQKLKDIDQLYNEIANLKTATVYSGFKKFGF